MSEKTNSTFSWGANEIAKRIKVVFGFCLFPAALCLVNGNATGLLSLLLLAESFGLLYAFKAAEIENSKKLVRILKILAPVTLAYSLYLGVMTFVRAINGDFVDGLLGRVVASSDITFIVMAFICFFTAIWGSLAVWVSVSALSKGKIKIFAGLTALFLLLDILTVVGTIIGSLVVTDTWNTLLFGMGIFGILFAFSIKVFGNAILKGAFIGFLIAGKEGAIVGALVGNAKQKRK